MEARGFKSEWEIFSEFEDWRTDNSPTLWEGNKYPSTIIAKLTYLHELVEGN